MRACHFLFLGQLPVFALGRRAIVLALPKSQPASLAAHLSQWHLIRNTMSLSHRAERHPGQIAKGRIPIKGNWLFGPLAGVGQHKVISIIVSSRLPIQHAGGSLSLMLLLGLLRPAPHTQLELFVRSRVSRLRCGPVGDFIEVKETHIRPNLRKDNSNNNRKVLKRCPHDWGRTSVWKLAVVLVPAQS